MKKGPLRVALVGAGDIAANHLVAWRRCPNVQVVAICDLLQDRAAARASAFGIESVYGDAEAMMRDLRPDVLDIATSAAHAEMVRLAARYGADCLCQKPLTTSLGEAERLIEDVDGRIRLMVNENRRFSPLYRTISTWLQNGTLGEFRQCHMIVNRSDLQLNEEGIRPGVVRSPMLATEERLLVGSVFTHQIDVLRFLLGDLGVVAARIANTETGIRGDTVASIFMETPRNAPVLLSGSVVAPGFGASLLTRPDRLEIIGSRSSFIVDGFRVISLGAQAEDISFEPATVYQACFDDAAAHFSRCLLDGTPFESDVRDNLQTLRIVEDIYASARECAA